MRNLIETLNRNIDKTPDEIAAVVADPLAVWLPLTTAVTPEFYEEHRNRTIAMYYHGRNGRHGHYCTLRQAMNENWSYRTDNPDHSCIQHLEQYPPCEAQQAEGWWFIGWDHRHTTAPTTAPDPVHDTYDWPEEPEDDDPDW